MAKTYEIDGAKYITHYGEALSEGQFERIHAVIVTPDQRILLRVKENNIRGTTGGHIDPTDADMFAAVKREILEEINCEVDRVEYMGYLEVIESDGYKSNWARVVTRLSKIMPPKPDPDRAGRWIYGRILAPLVIAIEESSRDFPLNAEQLRVAMKVARKAEFFTELPSDEYEVLNVEVHEAD